MNIHRWFLPAALAFSAPVAAQTSLTIYNDGRVLVRRVVSIDVPKGMSSQRLSLGAVDPSTLMSLDSGVTFIRATYDGAVDEGSALRRSVGRRLTFRLPESRDTVSALVLGVDPLRLRFPDGRIGFVMPGAASYPADVVVTDPVTTAELRSDRARDRLRLAYFTAGASWEASYDVLLGRGTARVAGDAVLASSTLAVDSAEIQLLAGAVSRAKAAPTPYRDAMQPRVARLNELVATEERVGEFHLYSLPGRATLAAGLTSSVALFDPALVPYEKRYLLPGSLPYWGGVPQQGDESSEPVEVRYMLKRPRATDFGKRPLPGGVARLYEADSAGRVQLVGEATIGHTAPGHDLDLLAGTAFDITATRVQTSYVTRRDSVGGARRTVATADYRVTLRNETDGAVTVDVLEERGGEWSVLTSSAPAEKISSTKTRFRVPVPAHGTATLTYRLRVVW